MSRASRLGRLLGALQNELSAGCTLGAPRPPQPLARHVPVLQRATDPCRGPAGPAESHPLHSGGLLAPRSFATAPAVDDGVTKQFNLAQLGEGIKECELLQWHVAEGDRVEEFGNVCLVQHDKATLDISSPFTGVVRKLHHAPGDIVQVGDPLVDIVVEGGQELELHSPPLEQAAGAAAPLEHAPGTGKRARLHPAATGSIGEDEVADRVLTSPAVRRIAREHSIRLDQVEGSGPNGRVTKDDLLAYLDALASAGPGTVAHDAGASLPTTEEAAVAALSWATAHVAQPTAAHAAAPGHAAGGAAAAAPEPLVVPLRGYRKAMVRSMTAALQVPHFHFCDEVQMDALVELRQRLKGDPALDGTKLTYMPFFLKAAALALAEFPAVNSSLAADAASLLQHRHVNLGVAMATPHGLAVPNIKNVQDKTVLQLARELARLQAAAAANQLGMEDVTGGTFSLSNIGAIGGTYATPLVNPPEVAIMAVGSVQRLPRFAADGATVVPASILNISLGADHRVVDGATLASFARCWGRYIENPGMLVLHMK